MVVSKEQGYAEMDRWGKKNLSEVEIFDGNYRLIAHEDAIEYGDGLMLLTGNGFILKRQGKTSTGLAVDELLDVADCIKRFLKAPMSLFLRRCLRRFALFLPLLQRTGLA